MPDQTPLALAAANPWTVADATHQADQIRAWTYRAINSAITSLGVTVPEDDPTRRHLQYALAELVRADTTDPTTPAWYHLYEAAAEVIRSGDTGLAYVAHSIAEAATLAKHATLARQAADGATQVARRDPAPALPPF